MLAWLVIRVRKMKKITFILILSALLGMNFPAMANDYPPCAQEYQKVTDDSKVCAALDELKGTIGEFSRNAILGENLTNRPIKIEFKGLTEEQTKTLEDYYNVVVQENPINVLQREVTLTIVGKEFLYGGVQPSAKDLVVF